MIRSWVPIALFFLWGCAAKPQAFNVDQGQDEADDSDREVQDSTPGYNLILPAEGSRMLDFPSPEGWFVYGVIIEATDADFQSWLLDHSSDLVPQMDAVILRHPITDFADSYDSATDGELMTVLGKAWEESTGGTDGESHFIACVISVCKYHGTD